MNHTSQSVDEIQFLEDRITGFLSLLDTHHIQTSIRQTLTQIHDWLDLDSGYWLNLNVFGALSPDQLIRDGRNTPHKWDKLQIIEYFRNGLIFTPIFVTWLELSRATNAYGALLAQRPELRGENLLFLWQSGALAQSAVSAPLPFNAVALIDVILIGLIIFLSMVINLLRDEQVRRWEQTLNLLAAELSGIAWEVNRIFMLKRRQFFEHAEERTIALLNGLENYVDTMNDQYQKVLEKTSQEAREVVGAVRHQVDVLADQNVELASKQKLYLENLTLKIDQLLTRISSRQDEWINQLTQAGEMYQRQWEQIVDQWKDELDSLSQVTAKQVEQFNETRNLFAILRENLKTFQKATQQLIPALENAQKSWGENVSILKENQARIVDSMQSLEGSLRSVELVSLEWTKNMDKTLAELRELDGTNTDLVTTLQQIMANDQELRDVFRQHLTHSSETVEAIRSSLIQFQSLEAGDGFKGNHEQPN